MPHILLVDDEETLRVSLSFTLSKEGFEVTTAADGVTALRLLREKIPDLVILDLMLPGLDGMQVCRWIRSVSDVPIIMLTARGEVEDKVAGLGIGADDYVAKPFSPRELVARVQAHLRRRLAAAPPPATAAPKGREVGPQDEAMGARGGLAVVSSGVIAGGTVRMDLDRHEVWVLGERVELPPKEFQLLHVLLSHRGRVLSREALISSVWGDEFMGDPKTLDVHVRWLRAKIEPDPAVPRHLITVRGVGFRFDP